MVVVIEEVVVVEVPEVVVVEELTDPLLDVELVELLLVQPTIMLVIPVVIDPLPFETVHVCPVG